jgi:hypothetical protein
LRVKRIAGTSDGAGECRFPTLYAYQDTDPLILLRHVVCALAGVAAQSAFTQGYSAADIARGGSADHAGAEQLALLIAKDGAAEIMGRAQAMAARLVSVHREQIFALARQLYVRGSLTNAEMRAIAADTA